jgi:hypothetical protein
VRYKFGMNPLPKFDEIGYWSEVKLDIIRSYASAHSQILTGQRGLYHVYVDGFAGAGEHLRKGTGESVAGSPMRALEVVPPFREYFFVDLDGDKQIISGVWLGIVETSTCSKATATRFFWILSSRSCTGRTIDEPFASSTCMACTSTGG